MTDHTISVLTPSFNYGNYLADAVDSTLRQNAVQVQHVIQDGESTDSTAGVLQKYGDRIDWLSEPDGGQSDALNRALRRANGDWIAWLNADEFYFPGALGALVRHATATGADVVYGDAVFVDARGRFLRLLPQHAFSRGILRAYGCFISSCAVVVRRDVIEDAPWDASLRRIMDWDFFLRLDGAGAKFEHVRYPVGAFRVHPECVTAQPASRFAEEYIRVESRFALSRGPIRLRLSKLNHALQKLMSGAYSRQIRGARFRGADMRWFGGETRDGAWELLNAAYGAQPGT